MKVAILFFLVAMSIAAATEKHYHYHFEHLNADDKRVLMSLVTQRHRGWWAKFKCHIKYMFKKDKKEVCLREAQADEDAKKEENKKEEEQKEKEQTSASKSRRLNGKKVSSA